MDSGLAATRRPGMTAGVIQLTPCSIGLHYGRSEGSSARELRVRANRENPSNLIRVMPAKGRNVFPRNSLAPGEPCHWSTAMNKPLAPSDLATPKVTTGPVAGSRKIHVTPEAAPDLRVPLREIALSKEAGEPPLPVYDTSGPYTDDNAAVDVENSLKRARVDWVRERGGVEEYEGRPLKPVDNGNASGKHLARAFPNTPKPMRALDGKPVTQLEWARLGIVTKEMIYVAERENLGRKQQLERAEAARADGESFGAAVPLFITPEFVREEVARGQIGRAACREGGK